jgi:DNA replication protein DnaC
MRSFCFLLFLLSGAGVRSGPERSRARRFRARRSAPLRARTAAKESTREEKTWFVRARDLYTTEGNHDNDQSQSQVRVESKLGQAVGRATGASIPAVEPGAHASYLPRGRGSAQKGNWTYRDFLALLLAEEVAHRKQTRLQRFTHKAHFPFFKTIDEFDFSLQTTLRQSLLGSYLGPDFVTEGRSLILYGKTGRGKTHLAIAIGYRAIQNGFETFFTTAAELIEHLSNASKRGQLQEALLTYTHPHALVIDEVGYLTYGPDAANVLFHVVNDRHLRKRPMVFTTNKPLSEWGKVLHDEDLAAAILDRVLERGRFIRLDGPSGRTRHLSLEEVLPATIDRARISGNRVPQFPEPTLILLFPSNSSPCRS